MKTWLNSDQLKEMTGKSLVTAQRIIKTHAQAYPLCVRKVIPEGKKSRPFYEVLWDTTTNQPATSADQSTTGEIYDTANRNAGSATSHSGDTATTRSGILSKRSSSTAADHCADDLPDTDAGDAGRYELTDSNESVADRRGSGAINRDSTITHQPTTGEDHAGIHNYTRGNAGVGAGKTPKKLEMVEGALGGDKDVSSEPENNNKSNQIFGNANQPIVSQQLGESDEAEKSFHEAEKQNSQEAHQNPPSLAKDILGNTEATAISFKSGKAGNCSVRTAIEGIKDETTITTHTVNTHGYANPSTDATLDRRDISSITSDSATSPRAVCAGIQQPVTESGRGVDFNHAPASALVESSALPLSESVIAAESVLLGERQAGNGGEVSQGSVAEVSHANVVTFDSVQRGSSQGLDSSTANVVTFDSSLNALLLSAGHEAVVLEGDNLPVIAANIDFHPESFDCQIHYVLRLIEKQQLGKVCRSNALTRYFKTVLVADAHRAEWDGLLNNKQRVAFAEQHKLVGEIPNRLKAEGNPKSLTGRPSTVPAEAEAWISKTVHQWADDNAPVLTATRCRTDYMLQQLLKKDTGIALSEKQIANVVNKNNLRQLMNKPQGKEGKKVGKQKGTYPRLPVNSLWLMDGVVPELLYIRGLDGRYTKITCIGIEDVGSRVLLGFKEYYSESGASSVNLFKAVMTDNQFKKGTSGELIAPTLRPDKGSGFMTSMGACSFAISKAYAESHHFAIDFKEANAGSPTEKAHLESSWKSVHSSYRMLVQTHFAKLGKIDKTPIVSNHKRGIEMSALYIDITLEELRAAGIAEEFKDLMNNRLRQFTEDNRTLRFIPNKRWARYLANLNDDDEITDPLPESVFSADDTALEMLNVFGYAKHDSRVNPDMTIQYKVGHNVPRNLGFSVTRPTPVRVSEMPDGSGRLAIFTAKEKKSKTKHDFGAEFLGFATAKAIGGNEEKAAHVRRKKADRVAEVLEIAKKDTVYSLILKEIQPFLVSFGSENDTKGLDILAGMKLTPELAYAWMCELCVDKDGVATKIEFKRFLMEARKRLQNILVLPTTQKRNMR